jgi:hypothetical protein
MLFRCIEPNFLVCCSYSNILRENGVSKSLKGCVYVTCYNKYNILTCLSSYGGGGRILHIQTSVADKSIMVVYKGLSWQQQMASEGTGMWKERLFPFVTIIW